MSFIMVWKVAWAVCETEEHYQRFEQPSVGPKGTLPLIALMNANIVVPPVNIQLGEVFGSAKLIDELRDEGYVVAILMVIAFSTW